MAKIFVGSLPTGITQDTFQQLFQSYGTFTTIVCNPEKRYGFVVYSTMEEANAAIGAMNGFQMEGTVLVVKLANNQGGPGEGGGKGGGGYGPMAGGGGGGGGPASAGERLYIKGLPAGYTDDLARELFSNYGTVVDSKVLVNNGKTDDGTGQSVAIIKFGSMTEAQWLVDNLNGNIPQGLARPVEVSFAGQKPAQGQQMGFSPYGGKGAPMAQQQWNPMASMMGGGGGKGGGAMEVCVPAAAALKAAAPPTATCYVKGLPLHADDLYVYRVFAPFGRILSAKAMNKGTFCIAFVTFASDLEAQEAVMQVNGQMLTDGTSLQVSIKNQKGAGGAAAGLGALAGLAGFGL